MNDPRVKYEMEFLRDFVVKRQWFVDSDVPPTKLSRADYAALKNRMLVMGAADAQNWRYFIAGYLAR